MLRTGTMTESLPVRFLGNSQNCWTTLPNRPDRPNELDLEFAGRCFRRGWSIWAAKGAFFVIHFLRELAHEAAAHALINHRPRAVWMADVPINSVAVAMVMIMSMVVTVRMPMTVMV